MSASTVRRAPAPAPAFPAIVHGRAPPACPPGARPPGRSEAPPRRAAACRAGAMRRCRGPGCSECRRFRSLRARGRAGSRRTGPRAAGRTRTGRAGSRCPPPLRPRAPSARPDRRKDAGSRTRGSPRRTAQLRPARTASTENRPRARWTGKGRRPAQTGRAACGRGYSSQAMSMTKTLSLAVGDHLRLLFAPYIAAAWYSGIDGVSSRMILCASV